MAKSTVVDVFPNRAFESVTMSGANALTFSQVQFGVGLFQGVAAVIHRIEWYLDITTTAQLIVNADLVQMALTNRDDLTVLSPTSQNVLAQKEMGLAVSGTPANMTVLEFPLVSSFADLGGGGLIIPANPLYVAMDSVGLSAAGVMDVIIYLTFKTLSDAEYVELIQTIMPANL